MAKFDYKRPSNTIKGKKSVHWHDTFQEYSEHERMVSKFLTISNRKKQQKGDRCRACDGFGYTKEERDIHKSAGTVPCTHCAGTGKVL